MDAVTEKTIGKGVSKDKGTKKKTESKGLQSVKNQGKSDKKDKPKDSPKPLGKCASFVEFLKTHPSGVTWEDVEKAPWNTNQARYPQTFKKLKDEGMGYKIDGKLFYGKPPAKNGKDKKE